MIKWSAQHEEIIILNINVSNARISNCIKQTLLDLKGEIDCNTIIVEDFNTPCLSVDRLSRKTINNIEVKL